MKDFEYRPREARIKAGQTIAWLNDDVEPHTITADGWDSGDILPGKSYSRTFTEPGTFQVHCVFHPDMVGQIIVDR